MAGAGSSPMLGLITDRRGNFTTMTALLTPVLFAAAAFAVDQGALYQERRDMQRVVDLAAITAAGNMASAEAAALATLADNGFDDVTVVSSRPVTSEELAAIPESGWLTIETGSYLADAATASGSRFAAGATPANAVHVTFGKTGRRYFASRLIPTPEMSVSATGSSSASAAFSVGSRLAALDGGILNALIGGLTGSSLSLGVMDYNALLDADVDLLGFFDALATELDITAGTYDDVLAAEASIGQIAAALAEVAGDHDDAALAIAAIGAAADADLTVPLSHVFDLGTAGGLAIGGSHAGFGLAASMMEILTAGAAIANGEHQVTLDLGAQVPGLAALTLTLAVGEPPQFAPWFSVGGAGDIVRTAQTRLLLSARIGGTGVLAGKSINLPIYLELAYAEAKLASVTCPPATPRVTVHARPGIADLRIASISPSQMADFSANPSFANAQIVAVAPISVTGQAHVRVGNANWSSLAFSSGEIEDRVVKSVSTTSFTASIVQSLANDLDLTVTISGLDLGLSGLVRLALSTGLSAVAPALDTVILNLLETLGIRLGEADVRVHGLVCQRSVLVQ